MKALQLKIYAMKAILMILLIWLYAVSILGFIYIILIQLNYDFSATYLSIILSVIGLLLGFGFYYLSFLNDKNKLYFSLFAFFTIVVLIISSYLLFGLDGLKYLGIIGFFFVMSAVPLISVYSILKNQKIVFYASAIGLMVFYFILILLAKVKPDTMVPFYYENQIELLLLFFMSFIFFLDIGSNSIYFTSVLSKITPNESVDNQMLSRFNIVVNKYILQISIFLLLCYLGSIVLLWNTHLINFEEILGLNLSSAYGVILLATFTLVGSLIFWYMIPREKNKSNTFNDPNFSNINEK